SSIALGSGAIKGASRFDREVTRKTSRCALRTGPSCRFVSGGRRSRSGASGGRMLLRASGGRMLLRARLRRGGGAGRQRVASSPVQTLQRTPMHDRHVALGARMVPFAGWDMPVQYTVVIAEHRAV